MKDLRLSAIVGMFLVIDLSASHAVVAAGPGAQVNQAAALGAERTEWIVLRRVRRLFADWTPHTFRNLPDRRLARNATPRDESRLKPMALISLHCAGWKSLEQDSIFVDLDALNCVACEVRIAERSVQTGTSIEAGLQSFAFGQVELRYCGLLRGRFRGRRSARARENAGERGDHGNCA